MKGIVFNEFVGMIEQTFGEEMLDDLLEENVDKLPSGGAYTAVGTYDHSEILVLVTALSERVNVPVADLVKAFGRYLAETFVAKFPDFFTQCKDSFSFFKTIDDHIHVEVHKLYPDAELPEFDYQQINDNQLLLIYRSSRDFSQLALGLIERSAEHYGETIQIEIKDHSKEGKTHKEFLITRT